MTVGEALAVARTRAGLSVDEVSERTRIREIVIRGIERDDYELCGGDLYVRGYLRVIADAVGLDARPLIREFEGSVAAPSHVRPVPVPSVAPGPAERSEPPELFKPPELFESPELFEPPEPPRPPEPVPKAPEPVPEVIDLTRVGAPAGPVPAGLRQTSMDLPALGHGPARPRRPSPARRSSSPRGDWEGWLRGHRRVAAAVAVAIAVLAVAVAGGQIFSGGSGASASDSAAAGAPGLTVPFALAFGPNGTADGDNSGSAMNPVTPGATQPWSTQQYPTAEFGQQKTGTGLLLDMGSAVTVTSVVVDLGTGSGAGLQVRAGNSSVELAEVASAKHANGGVVLRPGQPVAARYLLIWFTRLPRASDGLYQASVYHVTVNGHP